MSELDRRQFLKIVGLSAGAAAASACKEPVEAVVPYLNQPEEIIPGVPTLYASTCRECPCACSAQVKTREGRPIKVDGNPEDAMLRGKLCIRGQVSLSRTYDVSRFKGPQKKGASGGFEAVSWDEGLGAVVERLKAAGPGKIAFVSGLETGTLGTLIEQFVAVLGSNRSLQFELYGYEPLRQANQELFGVDAVPSFDFGKADVTLAFGTDFLETWLNPVQNQIGFTAARRGGKGFSAYVGPRLSLSGSNCDVWLSPKPGTEINLALAIAGEVARKRGVELGPLKAGVEGYTLEKAAESTGVPLASLKAVAERAAAAKSLLALPPGAEVQGENATAFAAAVQLINYAAGSIGKTVVFGPDHNLRDAARYRDLIALRDDLQKGALDVLFVHDANPAYSVPGFAEALAGSKATVISLSSANDETTALASFVLPDHTPYEAWGDAEPMLGVKRLQQPTINPLFDTRAAGDVLIDLAKRVGKPIGDGDFRSRVASSWKDWNNALAHGGEVAAAPAISVSLAASAANLRFQNAEPAGVGDLALVVHPSLHFYDGRSARFASLQEVPDPVTKLVWGSHAELHPVTAAKLGVATTDIVKLSTERGNLELPVIVHNGLREGIVAVSVGQGHQPVEPTAPDPDRHARRHTIGVNVLKLLPEKLDPSSGALAWLSTKVKLEKTGKQQLLATPQATFDQEGRGIAQAISLSALRNGGAPEESATGEPLAFAASVGERARGEGEGEGHHEDAPFADALHLETKEFDPADDAIDPLHRWGMSIDLDACTGCGACVTACVTENNIPAIGETLVRQGREMHWIRIERYVDVEPDESLAVRHIPMMCQHCGAAPCESVCPVYATYHNKQGLNVMVPNRCIGTRYCGNNCPYKVRRFNYFPYDFDYREPENLVLNPDVMVRSKGVMEKCTFCVQRINVARDKARTDGLERVPEGAVTPACAQACPSDAIVFGNYKNPEDPLTRLRKDPRAYWVLHHLHTRPAVTYQKKIDRPVTEEA